MPNRYEPREGFGANPFARLDDREDRKDNREDAPLAEDNTSLRELTEVFKPLPTTEYLKQQALFSKNFSQ